MIVVFGGVDPSVDACLWVGFNGVDPERVNEFGRELNEFRGYSTPGGTQQCTDEQSLPAVPGLSGVQQCDGVVSVITGLQAAPAMNLSAVVANSTTTTDSEFAWVGWLGHHPPVNGETLPTVDPATLSC